MKLIESCTDTCYVRRLIDIPGNTPEELKENYLKSNYEILDILETQFDALASSVEPLELITYRGDTVWESDEPDEWDPYKVL